MVNSPDVSVIVPVFNGGDGLEFSLRSLLKQTLKKLEIIVVNDASTDNSEAVINHLASENGNIVAIHLPENQGVHEARLAGIKKAAAPWIGFLDADDFARPNMFEVMLGAGKQENVDIVVCGSYRVTPERKPIKPKLRFKRSKKVDSDVFEKFCRFEFGTGMLWNKLYRREVLTPYGDMHFPWRQNINEDLLLNIGCFYKAESVFVSDEVLHEYVLNESSITSTINNAKAYVDTYRAYALAVSFFSELGSDVMRNIIEMYRTQLTWGGYLVDDVTKLMGHQKDLNEAADLIYRSFPAALVLISARQRPTRVGARLAISSLMNRCLTLHGF
ncbi:Glycosyl transferase family 2 [Marinobacter sp. LV10R510-11A]|uniref:glycosyltransferase family 2 protein n=1 Tax=Marinobacter sp. LV10R510-11A TaxID=1415568 RepID=UPI000BB9859F|nr:glycosyltransferase family 2 protein [Marinobacter sp. LV10R510-11A]SOB74540.1 Glycosyl transferase family 2 [Marinobacter sp. LV10R510-11A]